MNSKASESDGACRILMGIEAGRPPHFHKGRARVIEEFFVFNGWNFKFTQGLSQSAVFTWLKIGAANFLVSDRAKLIMAYLDKSDVGFNDRTIEAAYFY
jgi:hypothetical protein